MTDNALHIKIDDVQAGKLTERVISYDPIAELENRLHSTRLQKGLRHLDEAFVYTPDANSLLRDGIRLLAFEGYNSMPRSFGSFTQVFTSTRPHEEYLRDGAIGLLPPVKSGTEMPRVMGSFDGGVKIENVRYGGMMEVTGDELRFDRLGLIARQAGPELGRAGRMTEEQQVYNVITTTANFTRNSTTGDNDVGANTQTLTFNGSNLETAYTIISTSKDRRSSAYLGLTPDTLICGPRLMFAAKQLLMSDALMRTHGNTSAEVRGTGTDNIYRGLITNIVVSPFFSNSFNWALVDSKRTGLVFQEVEAFNVTQAAADTSDERYFTRDIIRFRAIGYFGVGIADDRPWFFSNSTTAPTVA